MMIWFILICCLILVAWALRGRMSPEVVDYSALSLPPDYQSVPTKNGVTAYRLLGSPKGPLIVLVPGFGTPAAVFDDFIPHLLEDGFRVLSFDLYGRGYSSRPPIPHSLQLFAEQLEDLVNRLDLDKSFYLLGLSMGGTVAATYTAKHPERVRKLMLLAPMLGPVDIGAIKFPLVGTILAPLIARKFPERQLAGALEPEGYPRLREALKLQMSVRGTTRSLMASAKSIVVGQHHGIFKKVGDLRVPTLLLWGNQDPILPYDDHLEVEELTGARFKGVLSAGHLLCLEKPDYTAAKCYEFLADDFPASSPKGYVDVETLVSAMKNGQLA